MGCTNLAPTAQANQSYFSGEFQQPSENLALLCKSCYQHLS